MPKQTPTSHHERLTVSIGLWLLALVFAACLVVAVFLYTNAWIGGATALTCLVAVVAMFGGWGSARVVVDDEGFQAGASRIAWQWVAGVEPLDAAALRRTMGPGAKATAHLLLRPYIPGAVRVVLDDPADPHPYWVVSTRHPAAVAAAAASHLGTHAGQAGR